jgi:hypothetical protein
MSSGWALTIAGVPHIFTTHAMGTLTSSSSLWWGGETGVTYADGWLEPPRGTITERARPLDGDLELAPLSFVLHDATSGGVPLLTSLAGKDSINVTSTPVPSSVTAAATSITVGDGTVFTSPCFAWINREAVRVTGVAGNVLTVTRGVLGTMAVAHTVDANRALFPEAFAAVPWTTRRKVCLWRVEGTTATLAWVGVAQRAPALGDGGATYAIQCDPLWTVLKQAPIGGELARTQLVGWSNGGLTEHAPLWFRWQVSGFDAAWAYGPTSTQPYRTRDAALRALEASISAATTATGSRVGVQLSASGSQVTLAAEHTVSMRATVRVAGGDPVSLVADPRGARYQIRTTLNAPPTMAVLDRYDAIHGLRCVSSLSALPTSWTLETTSEASVHTWERPALRLAVSADWYAIGLVLTTATSGDLGPRVDLVGYWSPRKPGLPSHTKPVVLTAPDPLQVIYQVSTTHWAYGLKHSVIALCEDGDTRDWDLTSVAPVARSTMGLRVARFWTFDGRRTLGALLTECCLLHGVTPVTRAGLLALHAWSWPSAAATPALTITATDIVGTPTWSRWTDGLANRVAIKGDALQITATQEHSRARYGPGRTVSVDLAGIDEQTLPVDDPMSFARDVVGRMELWSEPLSVVTVRVRGSAWTSVELGALVAVSEWMLPTGTGSRGLSSAKGIVIARTLDLATATVVLEVILFPRTAYPYAPCANASSVVSGTVLALASGYVDGTDTYSGGVDATTFAAGDVVDLIERDTTTAWTERLTIQSVDTGLNRVTFTGSMSATAQTKIGAGWVDVRFAPYADAQASQQSAWMFVADDTTRVIDGSAERERPIAP